MHSLKDPAVRTARVMEVLEWKISVINPELLQQHFTYRKYGVNEQLVIVLHYSATLDNQEEIFEQVIKPAIKWYCDWEDEAIDVYGNN